MTCPHCSSSNIKRNGTAKSRQRWLCRDCGRSHIDPSPNPPHRPLIGNKPMSAAERMRRVRAKQKKQG